MQRLEHLFAGQLMFSIAFENITTDHKNVLVIVMQIMKIDRIEILKIVIKCKMGKHEPLR